jgi:pyrroloquinoline quinone biosynthesis protein D
MPSSVEATALDARPVLSRRARLRFDRLSGGHVLLGPERGFRLNPSAAAVLALCDGQHSVLQIAQGLAPPEQEERVLADVVALVQKLASRGLLTVNDP